MTLAADRLPRRTALCHNDMDAKNVLWQGGDFRIIDLECLGPANPEQEMLDLAISWAGYELDEKTSLTTDAENNSFNQVKEGASITAARGFLLNDSSELTVVLTAYDKDYNEIIERKEITIPDDKAKGITGNTKYFEETGETPIKDGASVKSKDGEIKVTGYKGSNPIVEIPYTVFYKNKIYHDMKYQNYQF
jgi:hypothetical protein